MRRSAQNISGREPMPEMCHSDGSRVTSHSKGEVRVFPPVTARAFEPFLSQITTACTME